MTGTDRQRLPLLGAKNNKNNSNNHDRFTTAIANIGTADFRPSIPKEAWQWHACHQVSFKKLCENQNFLHGNGIFNFCN